MARAPDVVPLVDEGLGNSAYLVDLGDGRALVVDASRDLRTIRAAARRRGLRVAFAADTHLHADFLSGSLELLRSDGAIVLAPASGGREFAHTGLREGDDVDLGGLHLRTMATPGHTDEHLSFLLLDGADPVGVFTGGSLLVGSAARTDLVDPGRTEGLARAQYASLQRLVTLPDDVAVWPTHGAGSFCSAPPGTERTSTIGQEKANNQLLQAADEDTFVAALLGSLGSFPPYFLRLGEVNRTGPELLETPPTLQPSDALEVRRLLADGAVAVDVRPVSTYARGHVPGSLSIPLREAFASWLGWLAPHDRPLIVVREHDQDPTEIAWQAAKVGYHNVATELDGGLPAWEASGHDVATTPTLSAEHVDGQQVLDVSQDVEYDAGHLPRAWHVELGALAEHAISLPDGPMVVMCGHGERAASAASVLERAGRSDVAVVLGGPGDWASRHDTWLDTRG